MKTQIFFAQDKDLEFKRTLKKRADQYFREKGISGHYTPGMLLKTTIMLLIYIVPFILILSVPMPFWLALVHYFIMGFGVAGIGMSVMHDANHYGYSAHPKINRWMGNTIYLIGADAYNWKIKHNKLHHVFTNIYGRDEDINSRVILRFAYAAPLKKYHKYQHWYAWIFYSLMTFSMIFGDITKRLNYRKRGVTNISRNAFRRAMAWLIFAKIAYFGAIIGLPIFLTDLLWWQVLIGFAVMHITAGTILSLIFQMAHVVEGPEQLLPDENGNMPDSLIVHQLRSSSDFSRNNKILSWYVGGLNFQTEHHLFPRICHVHYPALAKIVEETTSEYNLPYHVYDSFANALASHVRTLKKLGRVKV